MDSNFNTVPNTGTFGNAVNKINENFLLAKVAIDGIELSTTKNKGIFTSVSSLETTVPSPNVGDWAGVGTAFPVKLYVCNTAGTWADSGSTWNGGDINLSDYVNNTTFNGLVGATNNINIDKLIPLSTGYYTLSTAITALVGNNIIKSGMVIIFRSSANEFQSYQFVGDIANFTNITLWINTKENSSIRYAKNNTGATVTKGKLVYISGSTGENPLFLLATNTDYNIAARTWGMTYESINNNAVGRVINFGMIENLDTSAYTAGTELWLGVNGEFTNVRPTSPSFQTSIGMVIRQSSTVGSIFVNMRYVNIEGIRSQNSNTSPSSKLFDDELNKNEYYNVTNRIPLSAGQYYDLASAIAAVPVANRKLGLKLTYMSAIYEKETLTVTTAPTASGNITITLNGVAFTVAVDPSTDTTTTLVANKIRASAFTGWTVSGTGATVIFTKNAVGVCSSPVFNAGTTGSTATIVITVAGTAESFFEYQYNASSTTNWTILSNWRRVANEVDLTQIGADLKQKDLSLFTNNGYINISGQVTVNSGWKYSNFLPKSEFDKLFVYLKPNSAVTTIAYYSTNDYTSFIGGSIGDGGTFPFGKQINFDSYPTANYVILSYDKTGVNNWVESLKSYSLNGRITVNESDISSIKTEQIAQNTDLQNLKDTILEPVPSSTTFNPKIINSSLLLSSANSPNWWSNTVIGTRGFLKQIQTTSTVTQIQVIAGTIINSIFTQTNDYGIFSVINGIAEINDSNYILQENEHIFILFIGTFKYGTDSEITNTAYELKPDKTWKLTNPFSLDINLTISNLDYVNFDFKQMDVDIINIKSEQVTQDEDIQFLKDSTQSLNDIKKSSDYISIFNDDFSTQKTDWARTTNWSFDTANKKLTPTATGGINTNDIRLNRVYMSDKRVFRVLMDFQSNTVANFNMQRTTTNTGEGESMYQLDVVNQKMIMYAQNSDGRGVNLTTKIVNLDCTIVAGRKYWVEIEKNDFTHYFRLIDYTTGSIVESKIIGWSTGRQMFYYGFSLNSGLAFNIYKVDVQMLNNPQVIICGDSITEGVRLESTLSQRWSEILREKVGNSIISSVGGDIIDTILLKFNSEFNIIKPKYIMLTIGTNGGIATNTETKYKQFIDNCIAISATPIINLIPCNTIPNYADINNMLLGLADNIDYKDKFILGCRFDIATAISNNPANGVNSSLMTDGVHPNLLGTSTMISRFNVDIPIIFRH